MYASLQRREIKIRNFFDNLVTVIEKNNVIITVGC